MEGGEILLFHMCADHSVKIIENRIRAQMVISTVRDEYEKIGIAICGTLARP